MSKDHLIADVVTIGRVLARNPISISKNNISKQSLLYSFHAKSRSWLCNKIFSLFNFFFHIQQVNYIQKIDYTFFIKYFNLLFNRHYLKVKL